jgi:hypothetical protein
MRAISHILTVALLAGFTAAQSAPASQTVKPAAQQQAPAKTASATKTAKNKKTADHSKSPASAKMAAKSPFAPKTKATSASPTTAKITPAPVKAAPAAQKATAKNARTQTVAVAKAQPKSAKKPATAAKTAAKTTTKALPKKNEEAKSAAKVAVPAPAPEKKPEAAPVVVQSEPAKLPNPGKRDPFLSPLAMAAARGMAANCTTGKKCLVVDQILLKGIVQMKGGNLALVENGAKRPYVLHENDSLFNGAVVKITGDSIVLREEGSDILGRPVSKEVVKKVSAPAV